MVKNFRAAAIVCTRFPARMSGPSSSTVRRTSGAVLITIPLRDTLRVKAKPQSVNDNQEWLAFTIDPVGEDSAQVNIRWEKISVPFTVKVADVPAATLARLKTTVAGAKPDDWRTPMQAGNYLINNTNPGRRAQGMHGWISRSK